ncbi:hypothetical protein JOD67_005676 [Tenggerimyces flavus]|nr:hypothetical protein [Tenggerimyces flavus]
MPQPSAQARSIRDDVVTHGPYVEVRELFGPPVE